MDPFSVIDDELVAVVDVDVAPDLESVGVRTAAAQLVAVVAVAAALKVVVVVVVQFE